jgi:uncharacterized protein (TIGR00297 family)
VNDFPAHHAYALAMTTAEILTLCAIPPLAGAAVAARALDWRGALAGCAVAVGVALGARWPGIVLLAMFLIGGSAATRLGRARKESRGIAEPRGGRRSIENVIGKGGVAAMSGAAAAMGLHAPEFAAAAIAGALAAATADTLSSEIGKAFGGRTVLLPELRRVEPGTNGGVTLTGTLAGIAGACAIGAAAAAMPLLALPFLDVFVAVAVAGAVANVGESLIGRVGWMSSRLGGYGENLMVTALGGIVAVAILG